MFRKFLTASLAGLILFGMSSATVADAKPKKVKYAKSEIDKAIGKCALSVLGGAVLGGLVAGKKNRAAGALGGAAIGGVVCALIVDDAKKKDRIYQAQLAAVQSPQGRYTMTVVADDGQRETYTAQASDPLMTPVNLLVPVRIKLTDGIVRESPVLPGPEAICRGTDVSAELGEGRAFTAPTQVLCRDEIGDWYAYEKAKSKQIA
jgi:outer membrane lipoprotein SlyB